MQYFECYENTDEEEFFDACNAEADVLNEEIKVADRNSKESDDSSDESEYKFGNKNQADDKNISMESTMHEAIMTESIILPDSTELIELAPGRFVHVSKSLGESKLAEFTELLKEYQDVFVWSLDDLKGIPAEFGEHRIDLKEDDIHV